jgi:acyl-homoserine-lactone acylase
MQQHLSIRMKTCVGALVLLAASSLLVPINVLAGEATLYRDSWGVPHIWADDYAAAGYAVGRAQCEDNLSNVVYCLHAGVGRLAELIGPSMLGADIKARKLRHRSFSEAAWPELSPRLRELIEGYCAGVNDYLESHPDELPRSIAKVEPVQVIAWHRALLMLSTVAISSADAEASKSEGYHPKYNAQTEQSDHHPGVAPGKSNSWALSGSKTASGAPMLLIDPHWPASGHLQLYEVWLHVGDELHVGGFAPTGTPLPGLGVTPHAAWTVTAGGADSSDAYALQINPDNPHQYRFDDEWVEMDVQQETIRIRQPDGSFMDKSIEVLATRHGPILETKTGVPFAAAMGGYQQADAIDQFFRMATARTTEQFKAALALNRLSYFNLMWATNAGDIGYVQTGQAPLRPAGFNWEKMVPGWTSDSLYRGDVPFEGLPTVENPSEGFLQNCNVAANVVAPSVSFTKADFPPNVLYGHYGQYRARGARATQLLAAVDKAGFEEGRAIAFDTYVPPADLWVPLILQGYEESKESPADGITSSAEEDRRLAEAVRLLESWDRFATRDSTGATLFRFWRLACEEMESPVGRDRFLTKLPNTDQVRRDAITALLQAANRLHENYGRLAVPWGEVKRLSRGDREWPLSGDGLGSLGMDTLRATAGAAFNDDHQIIARGGQCVTSVVMLTDPPQIRAVVAYGQSNNPNSPHFADQAPLYSEERLREVPWTLEQLQANVESKQQFHH